MISEELEPNEIISLLTWLNEYRWVHLSLLCLFIKNACTLFLVPWVIAFLVLHSSLMGNLLKTLDTIGNCQRLVFSLGVSQHIHKITNLWKFELIGHRSCKIIMKEKTPLSHEVVCVQMLDLETSNSKSEVSKLNLWELLLSRKLHHFGGSHFSHCFILSTSPRYSFPIKVLCLCLFWVITDSVHCL